MRLLVCGGRDFRDKARLWRRLDEIDLEFCIDLIIEGEASGADILARDWAKYRGCPWWGFPARWDDIDRLGAVVRRTKQGKPYDAAAGSIRNQRMLDEGRPSHFLATPGGSGTADMIKRASARGVQRIDFS